LATSRHFGAGSINELYLYTRSCLALQTWGNIIYQSTFFELFVRGSVHVIIRSIYIADLMKQCTKWPLTM